MQSNAWNPENVPLQQVISDHFMTTKITSDSECTVEEFQKKNDLRINSTNVFIEYYGNPVTEKIRDVMLMDKVIIIIATTHLCDNLTIILMTAEN